MQISSNNAKYIGYNIRQKCTRTYAETEASLYSITKSDQKQCQIEYLETKYMAYMYMIFKE